ncbi:HNH endonuclease [Clostridium gasigenes]|uniref:HNH endonuclease n=1 Tax=Clostridium gasigenes TaxID=94869 RepID=UPI001C0D1CAB|nr:HNH endonuclease [Clostridium gasigenes]MBU3102963.1 HNH endonuclease [Clostridium gasigenes]
MDKQCIECGNPSVEGHHIIYRSETSAMINSPLNLIMLCHIHHRGNNGPHMRREIDIKYKREFQQRLEYLFSLKECYSEDEVKEILMIPKQDARKIVKVLCTVIIGDDVGYKREDIIKQAMGGRLYG